MARPGSGFRGGASEPGRTPRFRVEALAPDHPVLAGLAAGFEIEDELYLKTRGFEARVVPLLRAAFEFVGANLSPPALAPRDEQRAWTHPPGSDVVAWAKQTRASRVVAIELGDGPSAYANPGFRRLVGNALRFAAARRGGA